MQDEEGAGAEDQGFFQRWSRRKLDAGRASARESTAEVDDGADAEIPEEAPLTDADMPPLETLDQDSDFSLFMSAGVSEALRRKALRKLFRSPKFNVRDGLCDYDDDYSGLSPLGDIVTTEMRRTQERLAEKVKQEAARWIDEQPGDASLAETGSSGRTPGGAQRDFGSREDGDSASDADT